MQIKIAELSDIESTLKLHNKYQIDHINEEDKQDGFVTTAFTKEELTQLIVEEQGLFIAKNDNDVLAYVMAASWDFWSQWAMFEFMIEDLSNLEYKGKTLSTENSYQYGPICIDKTLRGSGMLEGIFNFAREEMAKRYPILVTFVNKINKRSYEAHSRKLGLEMVQEFHYNGNEYYQFVYDTSKPVQLSYDIENQNVCSAKPFIYIIDYPLEYLGYSDLHDDDVLERVYSDMEKHYYWSNDFSAEYYVAQAKAGCIAVTMENDEDLLMVPEIQKSYAILDFKDLHISRKVKKLLRRKSLELEIAENLDEVFLEIKNYHGATWFKELYLETLKEVNSLDDNCRVVTAIVRDEGKAIAGEIGYIIGKTYTSLAGFSSKERYYANYGTAQLVLLAQYLEQHGFAFLNLGQPYMQYKLDLGAKVYEREEFLRRWFEVI
ncbi:GNAT family N-acetyltransferase [bacterium]|nr:GNAT family N-acetyltransferase [bacterium]MBU1958548.1 GNAT family N-acetyltransferase [bacterium]